MGKLLFTTTDTDKLSGLNRKGGDESAILYYRKSAMAYPIDSHSTLFAQIGS